MIATATLASFSDSSPSVVCSVPPIKAPSESATADRAEHGAKARPIDYPGHFLVKKITTGGTFHFQNRFLYLAKALVDQPVGLEETDDGLWAIHFSTVLLASFDEHDDIMRG